MSVSENKTRVIHVRDAPEGWRKDSNYVYIGRENSQYRLPRSYFHNPYSIGKDGNRQEVLEQFNYDLEQRLLDDSYFREAVANLYGKTLVCWCKSKKLPATPCHGDFYVFWAEYFHKRIEEEQAALKAMEQALTSIESRKERLKREEEGEEALSKLSKIAINKARRIRNFDDFKAWRKRFFEPIMEAHFKLYGKN